MIRKGSKVDIRFSTAPMIENVTVIYMPSEQGNHFVFLNKKGKEFIVKNFDYIEELENEEKIEVKSDNKNDLAFQLEYNYINSLDSKKLTFAEFAALRMQRIQTKLEETEKKLHDLQDLLAKAHIPESGEMVEIKEYDENGELKSSCMSNFRFIACYETHSICEIWDEAIKESKEREMKRKFSVEVKNE